MASETTAETSAALEELRAAHERLAAVDSEIETVGETEVDRVAEVHDVFTNLLDRYESSATGTGREEFQSFLEFEGELADFEDDLADDLPRIEAFEEACELLDRRRLDERDFERAREALDPATEIADLLVEREQALADYREARSRIQRRIRNLEDKIDDLEDTLAFGSVDFESSVEPIREPIQTYNESIETAFRTFRSDAPARDVLSLLETTAAYPLVSFPPVPEDLRSHLTKHEVGTETIPTLMEYGEFSLSKLRHYVESPREFRTSVAGNRTFLERLDAEPLTIEWPPPDAQTLRLRIDELVSVVGRFADDEVVATVRNVRRATREADFERLRNVAMARAELSDEERERLRTGEVENTIEALREQRGRLESMLSEYPAR